MTNHSSSTASTVSFCSGAAFTGSIAFSRRPQQLISAPPVLTVKPPHSGQTQYFAFFDVNKERLFGNRNDKTYTVPVGACYFIISETAANMASIVITPHA